MRYARVDVEQHLNGEQRRRLAEVPGVNDNPQRSLAGWLGCAFEWSTSPHGLNYWTAVHDHLHEIDQREAFERQRAGTMPTVHVRHRNAFTGSLHDMCKQAAAAEALMRVIVRTIHDEAELAGARVEHVGDELVISYPASGVAL